MISMIRLHLFFSIVLGTLIACNNSPDQSSAATDGVTDMNTFENLLKKYDQVVDVRTPEEFAEGFIPNAVNIDYYSDDFESRIVSLDKEKPVLIYCKSGGRSGKSYSLLKSKGYKEVYDLEGGFTAWSKAGKPYQK